MSTIIRLMTSIMELTRPAMLSKRFQHKMIHFSMFPALRLHLLVALSCSMLTAQMTRATQAETLAWGQKIGASGLTVFPGPVGQDETGESYGLFLSRSGSNTSISLRGFSLDGTPLFAKTVLSVTTNAEAKLLSVTKTINVTPYVVVACRYQLASGTWNTFFAMYDSGGTIQWTHVYADGTNSYPIGIDAPGDGYVYLAETGNFPAWHLQVEKLSMGGAVMGGSYNTRITPNPAYQAYHSGSTWIVSGYSSSAPSTTAMFGLCDDSTAALKFSKIYYNHTTGTNLYGYSVFAYPYNGNAFVIENFNVHPNVGANQYYHNLWDYDLSGAEQWHSQTRPGTAFAPALVTGTSPSYLMHTNMDGNGHNIERLNPNGALVWSIPQPTGWSGVHLAADSQGFLLSGWDAPASTILGHLQRYDTNGLPQGSIQTTDAEITSLVDDGANVITGIYGVGSNASASLLQRYVLGFAQSSVTSDVTSVKSGGSVHFTLHFNGPAPAAGTAKIHSTSPLLQFAGSQDYILSYASGAPTALFTGIVGTVATSTPAEVIVTLNGVKRATYLTLNP